MHCPELAVLISTYERPWHLKRSLLSIALQRGVAGKIEVVVTDDGSRDETRQVVEMFSRENDFPVRFTTHVNDGFRLARCRNEGIAASTAPYLLFTDADCLLPPDHLAAHFKYRRPGLVIAGDCYRLDAATTAHVDESALCSGNYLKWVSCARPEDSQQSPPCLDLCPVAASHAAAPYRLQHRPVAH